MKRPAILYRARQFLLALRVEPLTESELASAFAVLNPKQMTLFLRLQLSEQRHAIRVLETLTGQGETHPDLLTAALLHDIGKTRVPLCLWERIFIVLGKKLFPARVKRLGQRSTLGWRRAFVVAENHPAWGAEMAAEADTSPRAVKLIHNHQEKLSGEIDSKDMNLLWVLQNADNQH
jgi:putative nucleotidyltransferase with HDIG domain